MKIIPIGILLLFQQASFCQINDSAFLIDLMKIEFEAYQKKDPTLWLKNVDEDAIFSDTDNMSKTRDQIVEEMKNAPDIFINSSEEYENVITKTYGNTCVLSCLSTFTYVSSNGSYNSIKFKFIRVHIKEGSDWKLVYHSAIPITENI